MVTIWAAILGKALLELLPAASLIVVGFLAEKHYTGRLAVFSNAVALVTFFYTKSNLPGLLIWYINILSVAGILALVSYVFDFSLPKEFYKVVGIFSSVISGIILLWGLTL